MIEQTFIDLTKKEIPMPALIEKLNSFFRANLDIPLRLAKNLKDEFAKEAAVEVLRNGLIWSDDPDLTLERIQFLKDMGVILQSEAKK